MCVSVEKKSMIESVSGQMVRPIRPSYSHVNIEINMAPPRHHDQTRSQAYHEKNQAFEMKLFDWLKYHVKLLFEIGFFVGKQQSQQSSQQSQQSSQQ